MHGEFDFPKELTLIQSSGKNASPVPSEFRHGDIGISAEQEQITRLHAVPLSTTPQVYKTNSREPFYLLI